MPQADRPQPLCQQEREEEPSLQPSAWLGDPPRALLLGYDQHWDAFMYPNNKSRRAKIPTSLLFLTTGTRVK